MERYLASCTPTLVPDGFTVYENTQTLFAETIEIAAGAELCIGPNAALMEV